MPLDLQTTSCLICTHAFRRVIVVRSHWLLEQGILFLALHVEVPLKARQHRREVLDLSSVAFDAQEVFLVEVSTIVCPLNASPSLVTPEYYRHQGLYSAVRLVG